MTALRNACVHTSYSNLASLNVSKPNRAKREILIYVSIVETIILHACNIWSRP